MSTGIRAELAIESADVCPLTALPDQATGRALSWTRASDDVVTEEFEVDEQVDEYCDGDVDEVFSTGDRRVYRFEREASACPCERVEAHGSPVVDAYSRGGRLHVVFHARDTEGLREIVTTVRDEFGSVSLERLVQTGQDGDGSDQRDLVLVDRSELTARQQEVLRVAHESGYFEHPRGANAGEVAAKLGVNRSTFVEHLTTAQSKLLSVVLADDNRS